MSSNRYLNLNRKHALFSPSRGAWIRYDDQKIIDILKNRYRAQLGTEIHEFSAIQIMLNHKITSVRTIPDSIENYIYTKYRFMNCSRETFEDAMNLVDHVKDLPKAVFDTVKFYINDAIGFDMEPEMKLDFSPDIAGTSDAVIFRNQVLRIHDLKTGDGQPTKEQLEQYAALYCLENDKNPSAIRIVLRFYHLDGIIEWEPEANDIWMIMNRMIEVEKLAAPYRKG